MAEGLTEPQAKDKLKKDGYNDLNIQDKKYFWETLFDIIKEPMILLLISGFLLYLVLGSTAEALLLLFFVLVIIAITIFQDRRAEKSLEALRNLANPQASVIRDGVIKRIPGREVVTEDIIIIEEGERIIADSIILESFDLEIDEALLTGESKAIAKLWGDSIYAGTLITRGHAKARVEKTGLRTKMGEIGKSLSSIYDEKTILQKELSKIIKYTAFFALSFCLILIIIYGLTHHNWLEGILAGIALAMGTLPEEFPIILTIFITMGAWDLAKKNVLAKNAVAIETLGKATVLCVDKTGTLTQNKMNVSDILAKNISETINYAILASKEQTIDPIEVALYEKYKDINGQNYKFDGKIIKEYPIEKDSISFIRAWKMDGIIVAAKGSPEEIINLCQINNDTKKLIEKKIQEMAEKGLRILGVAKGKYPNVELPDDRREINYDFLGLIGFSDPLRPETKPAIKSCYEAGVRVILISGDYSVTAKNIAQEIGLKNNEQVITGKEIDILTENELRDKIRYVNIFARVAPSQKLRIINALKKNKEVVAMTGDGINDAPALKAANIGISMGYRGTDVAREASDIVLLNDNFSSIISGIALGRAIFNNLKKALSYTVAIHVPIIGMSLLPIFFNLPLMLLPAHIVLMELIIDPTCTIAFRTNKDGQELMKKKPSKINDPLFNKYSLARSIALGLVILAVTYLIYLFQLNSGASTIQARSVAFLGLILGNLTLIVANISWPKSMFNSISLLINRTIIGIYVYVIVLLCVIFFIPFLREIFKIQILSIAESGIALIVIPAVIAGYEFLRKISNKE